MWAFVAMDNLAGSWRAIERESCSDRGDRFFIAAGNHGRNLRTLHMSLLC